jgi:hypothetical protein
VERRRLDRVPNAPIRELFERRHRHDPSLSAPQWPAEPASASHLPREFGAFTAALVVVFRPPDGRRT